MIDKNTANKEEFEKILGDLNTRLDDNRLYIPLFKQALQAARASLIEQFNEGADTDQLIRAHAAFMDGVLQLAWRRFNWTENTTSWRKSRIALVAVGGYGRSELLPNSDIDLLILLERNNHSTHRDNIQSFTTLLWDIGLEVGHSVRSLAECRAQAAGDVTVLTAMMEARIIVGSDEMLDKLADRISPKKIWPVLKFFSAKRDEQRARHEKSDHTESSLEPNVKSSPGGLRDIQTLIWIALRQYNTHRFDELVAQEILTQTESEELVQARSYLWKIRFALHSICDKDENRLLFEHQQTLATMFGYEDGDQLAVEQFMQTYYRTAQRVNTINETLLQHFSEVIAQRNKRLHVRPINDSFRVVNGLLEATSDQVFVHNPSAMLEMFVIIGSDDSLTGARASTIRLVREHVHLIDDDFRADPRNAKLFIELLGCNNHLFTQLRRMTRWGILGAYLPEFGRVIGQMQFDLFHIYTVDAHTLQVVRNMRRFRYKNNEQQFPVAAHIHQRLPRIELLYIAGLYHDIAKGMGGDHSELGTDIAEAFCTRHGLPKWDTNLVCWLVKNHLVMSTTAQRKDIQDPEIIHEFARLVGDQVRLDYIYALTVADINATNPTLWNGWRASLLRQLYSETKKALRHGLEEPVDRAEYIQDVQDQAIERLTEHGLDREAILKIWNNVDDDYFVRERIHDITWHTEAIGSHNMEAGPLILLRDDRDQISRGDNAGFTQIFVHTPTQKDLFLSVVSAIDQLDLDIVDARIATSSADLTFDTFTVLGSDGQPVADKQSRVEKIRASIKNALKKSDIKVGQVRRTPRLLKQFTHKTQVSMTRDKYLPVTVVEVTSADRPGLLTLIASVFVELGINLVSARITTLGERIEDVFYVTDAEGNCIEGTALGSKLTDRICEELDDYVEKLAS